MHKDLQIVILAAGKGTRMNSEHPKVLHKVSGKPMIEWVIEKARALDPRKIIIVESSERHISKKTGGDDLLFSVQKIPLGTADAFGAAKNNISSDMGILALYGDSPLIPADELRNLINKVEDSNSFGGFLSAVVEEENHFGRIKKDKAGNVVDVIQFRDASASERKIKEVDAGPMYVKDARIFDWLASIPRSTVTGEVYLNKVVVPAVMAGESFVAHAVSAQRVLLGINTAEELKAAEKHLKVN